MAFLCVCWGVVWAEGALIGQGKHLLESLVLNLNKAMPLFLLYKVRADGKSKEAGARACEPGIIFGWLLILTVWSSHGFCRAFCLWLLTAMNYCAVQGIGLHIWISRPNAVCLCAQWLIFAHQLLYPRRLAMPGFYIYYPIIRVSKQVTFFI